MKCFQVDDEFEFTHYDLGSDEIWKAVADRAEYSARR